MAAPVEAIVSSEPFFESATAPQPDDVETIGDDEEAEAESEQGRIHGRIIRDPVGPSRALRASPGRTAGGS